MPELMQESLTNKCAHKICSCPAKADTGFCGNYCQAASNDPVAGSVCRCGHPECRPGDIPMPAQSSQSVQGANWAMRFLRWTKSKQAGFE